MTPLPRLAIVIVAFLFACVAGGAMTALIEALIRGVFYKSADAIVIEIVVASFVNGLVFAAAFALPACFVLSYAEHEGISSPAYYVIWGSVGGVLLALFLAFAVIVFGLYVAAATVVAGALIGLAYWVVAGRHAGRAATVTPYQTKT
jgi:hypothetical protein